MKFVTRLSPVTLLPLLTFVVSAWVASGLFYHDLPSLVPTHWSVPGQADGFTPKPWGVFLHPILMTLIWLARPVIRRLSLPRYRVERFPGAFDFRIMLTIGVLFIIWTLVIMQSVFWVRVVAIPASIALIVGGSFLTTVPFSDVHATRVTRFLPQEGDWVCARRVGSALFVIAGLSILAIVAVGG
jgi:uncharacterized membrane protein